MERDCDPHYPRVLRYEAYRRRVGRVRHAHNVGKEPRCRTCRIPGENGPRYERGALQVGVDLLLCLVVVWGISAVESQGLH